MTNIHIERLSLDDLTHRLLAMESLHGYSTIEMYKRYKAGGYSHAHLKIEEWVSMWLLYLGAVEVYSARPRQVGLETGGNLEYMIDSTAEYDSALGPIQHPALT